MMRLTEGTALHGLAEAGRDFSGRMLGTLVTGAGNLVDAVQPDAVGDHGRGYLSQAGSRIKDAVIGGIGQAGALSGWMGQDNPGMLGAAQRRFGTLGQAIAGQHAHQRGVEAAMQDAKRAALGQPSLEEETQAGWFNRLGTHIAGYGEHLSGDVSAGQQAADARMSAAMESPAAMAGALASSPGRFLADAARVAGPGTVGYMIPAAAATRLGQVAGLAPRAAAAAGVGTQATMLTLDNASDAADAIRGMSDEELAGSPQYQRLLASGVTPAQARESLAQAAYFSALPAGAAINAATMGAAQRFGFNPVGDMIAGVQRKALGSAARTIAGRTAAEVGGEFVQEAGESVAGESAARVTGTQRPGAAGRIAAAGMLGALVGAPGGAVAGGMEAASAPAHRSEADIVGGQTEAQAAASDLRGQLAGLGDALTARDATPPREDTSDIDAMLLQNLPQPEPSPQPVAESPFMGPAPSPQLDQQRLSDLLGITRPEPVAQVPLAERLGVASPANTQPGVEPWNRPWRSSQGPQWTVAPTEQVPPPVSAREPSARSWSDQRGTPDADHNPLHLRGEIGWDQVGGRIIRQRQDGDDDITNFQQRATGDVVGRTAWVGKGRPDGGESDFWRNRPDKLTEKQAHEALDRFERGESLTVRQQRFIDYAADTARSYAEAEQEAMRDLAEFGEAARHQALQSMRDELQADIADADGMEALSVYQWAQRAMAAGAHEFDTVQFSNESVGAYAARMWKLIQEQGRGADQGAAGQDHRAGDQAREGRQDPAAQGRDADGGGFQLGQPATSATEADRQVSQPTAGLFGAPTARDHVDAAQRLKDAQRDGRTGTGRTDMLAGDGELFAGNRPQQNDIESPTRGPFGPVFTGLTNDPEGAITKLMREKRGEVPDAFLHQELGPVAFVYGDENMGLRHIEAKRGSQWVRRIPGILREGRLERDPKLPRAYIVQDADPANVAVIRLDWDGNQKTWLVTTHPDDKGKWSGDGKTSRTAVVTEPVQGDPSRPNPQADATTHEPSTAQRDAAEATETNPTELTGPEREAYEQWERDRAGEKSAERQRVAAAERSQLEGDADADRLGLRDAVNKVLGDASIDGHFLRDRDGLHGLATPEAIAKHRDRLEARAKSGGTGQLHGLFVPASKSISGKPFYVVFTGAANTPMLAALVAAHEVSGHYGLRKLLGKDLDSALNIALQNPTVKAVAEKIAEQRKFKSGQRLLAAEEALAELNAAIRTGDFGMVQRRYGVAVPVGMQRESLMKSIANFLRRLRALFAKQGIVFTDEQVRSLLDAAHQAAQGSDITASVSAADGALEQVVFHGTPHTVDRFRMGRMGTGEGAQAYGWGMYFASLREVAESYRKSLSGRVQLGAPKAHDAHIAAARSFRDAGYSRDDAIAGLQRAYGDATRSELTMAWEQSNPGNLYRVDIPEDSDLLDWDKPLSEQPEKVRQALQGAYLPHKGEHVTRNVMDAPEWATGEMLYRSMVRAFDDPATAQQRASEFLHSLGIPGLRYLDGGSRNSGQFYTVNLTYKGAPYDSHPIRLTRQQAEDYAREKREQGFGATVEKVGTHNYVIWDEAAISEPEAMLESVSDDTRQAYEARIDALFDGDKASYKGVRVLDRADILGVLGHGDKPLHLKESSVGKREGVGAKHPGMTPEMWKRVPDWIEGPVAAFKSQTVPGAIVLIGPELVGGRPVRITLEPNEGMAGMDVHVLTNAYEEGGTHRSPVGKWASEDKALLYLDQEKSRTFNERSGLQLPGEVRQLRGYKQRVATEADLRKYRAEREAGSDGLAESFVSEPPQSAKDKARAQRRADAESRAEDRRNEAADTLSVQRGTPGWNYDTGMWEGREGQANRLRTELQDKMLAWRDVQGQIEAHTGQVMADAANVHRLENLMHGRVGDAIDALERKAFKPLIEAMYKARVTLEALEEYLYALHAKERNAYIASINPEMPDGGSGMTNAQADAIIAKADKAKLDPLAQMVRRITKQTRMRLLAHGLITREAFDAMEAQYKYYVPLRGKPTKDTDFAESSGSGRGLDMRGNPVQQALGRGAGNRAENILANVFGDAMGAVREAERARVGRAVMRTVLANPNPDLWSVEPVLTERALDADGEVFDKVVQDWNDPTVIAVRHNGVLYKVQIKNEPLAKALNHVGVEQLGTVTQFAAATNRYFSAVLTKYNPAFMLVNASRDATFGMVSLAVEHGELVALKAALDYPKAIKASWNQAAGTLGTNKEWDRWAAEYAAHGGKTGIATVASLEDIQKKIGKGGLGSYNRQGAMRAAGAVADAIGNANDAVENALRLSAYVQLRRKDISADRAAEYAKNITVNFNRKGYSAGRLGAWWLFYNASVQGSHRVSKVLRNPKAWAYMGGLMSAQVVSMLAMMGMEDDDGNTLWEKIPDHVKRRNLVVPLGGDHTLTVPMPYGFNWFVYMGAQTVEAVIDGGGKSPVRRAADLVGDGVSTAVQSFSPVPFDDGVRGLLPQVLRPFANVRANENDFGNRIRNEDAYSKSNKPRASMGRANTLEIFKLTATGLNRLGGGSDEVMPAYAMFTDWAPEDLEYLAKTAGGGTLQFFMDAAALGLQKLPGPNDVDARDIPISKRFVSNVDPRASQAAMYYERRAALSTRADQLRAVFRSDGAAAARAFIRATPELHGVVLARKSDGSIRRSDTGGPVLEARAGSLFAAYKAAEKANESRNEAMRDAYTDAPATILPNARTHARDARMREIDNRRMEAHRRFNASWNRVHEEFLKE